MSNNEFKSTLTYEQYYKLNKDEVEKIINDLLLDYFKSIPFIKFKKIDFGLYWDKIESDIERYPNWGYISTVEFATNSSIYIDYYLKKSKGVLPEYFDWQIKMYDELDTYFYFFKLTRMTPDLKITFID
jgi:hypothetical protein